MTWEEFKTAHNFRVAERCCMNCKHGLVGYEGECHCMHPCIDEPMGRCWTGDSIADVCDLWERGAA